MLPKDNSDTIRQTCQTINQSTVDSGLDRSFDENEIKINDYNFPQLIFHKGTVKEIVVS